VSPEQTSRARQTKELYTQQYNKQGTEDGWHFLTGDRDEIVALADICGFRYKYVRDQKLYSHPPVFILISPKGKIVRYIHGLDYDPKTIELALIEAAEGKIGSPINILSYGIGCFTFDEATGKYSFQAMAIMRIGGAITAFLLVVMLVPYWFSRRGKASQVENNSELPAMNASGNS
jgi:protein SCO1/2